MEKNKEKEKGEINGKNNPIVIPRNHVVEDVLEKAGKGDYKAMGNFGNNFRTL